LKYPLYIFILLIKLTLSGQTIYFSGRTNVNGKHNYSKVIGENKFGIYILKFRDYNIQKDFIIERYSNDLNLISSQPYKLDRKEQVLKLILTDSSLHCITQTTTKISHYLIDYSLDQIQPIFKDLIYPKNKSHNSETEVVYSQSKKFILITYASTNKNNLQEFHIISRNLLAFTQSNQTYPTQHYSKDCSLQSTLINNLGQSSILFKVQTRDRRDIKDNYYWVIPSHRMSQDMAYHINPLFYLNNPTLYFHPSNGNSFVIGLYSYLQDEGSQGVSIFSQQEPDYPISNPFSSQTISSVQGAQAAQNTKVIQDLYIRSVMPHIQGSFVIIAEQYFISKEIENFYANGLPQSNTRSIYNYNDLIVMQFDSLQNTSWSNVIHKKQSTLGPSAYYSSYLYFASNQFNYIIFNEKHTTDNRLLLHKFNSQGTQAIQVLVEPTSDLMMGIPIEGRQTTYNSATLPLVNGRNQNLLKVVVQ
jgi:hypothetical protein